MSIDSIEHLKNYYFLIQITTWCVTKLEVGDSIIGFIVTNLLDLLYKFTTRNNSETSSETVKKLLF